MNKGIYKGKEFKGNSEEENDETNKLNWRGFRHGVEHGNLGK